MSIIAINFNVLTNLIEWQGLSEQSKNQHLNIGGF